MQRKKPKVVDFTALSSICPHLGCRVHWEPENKRFFCPYHNGVFDPSGRATEGPPKVDGQDLARYELDIRNDLLFIQIPNDMGTA
jgi:cytochrome b6-f complex iron-sulfur subunit